MKTLYVSDLDGTLLNSNSMITSKTTAVINKIIAKGEFFSYATARSISKAKEVTSSLNLITPVITYNGVFLTNPVTNEIILYNHFDNSINEYIKILLTEYNIIPNVYSFINGIEKVSIIPDYNNKYKKYYLESRKGDKRLNFVDTIADLYSSEIFSYLCIGEKEVLQSIYDILKNDSRFYPVLQQELYRQEYWLDIMPKLATKANAALKLKDILKCNKIVAFGDGINDIELFNIADKCYAVENANPELKKIATGIIESNDNDGVAKWLEQNIIG
ncbi:MAG: HAD family hydrolase [Firmicutes bacterium]|nr:HAD family hydrolase [Bacillota bacterium]